MVDVQIPERLGMSYTAYIEAASQHPLEIIDGERIDPMPSVFGPSEIINLLMAALLAFVTPRRLGRVFAETAFILPGSYGSNWVEGSRIPDVMYYAGTRIEDYKVANPDHALRPLELIPDLVVEVVSPSDLYSQVHLKIDAYLRDGVRLLWVIDAQRQSATVYAPGQPPEMLPGDGVLRGGDVIPGFEIALAELFR